MAAIAAGSKLRAVRASKTYLFLNMAATNRSGDRAGEDQDSGSMKKGDLRIDACRRVFLLAHGCLEED